MNNRSEGPAFAVVGHPNKGKSSIVAALAQNDAVDISSRSGTTKRAESLDIQVQGAGYTLIDTPGFQRPSRALAWLQRQATTADQRQAAVARFVASPECQDAFPDEVALLEPIARGAAILYVVDGSRPYNPDYEAEMEILRWTGQPSMALINPIESEAYVGVWQQALAQYFKVVRVFNPMLADRQRRDEMLEAFTVIAPQWRQEIDRVRAGYAQQELDRQRQACELLASLLLQLTGYELSQQTLSKTQAEALRPVLERRYRAEMTGLEDAAHRRLKELFAYHHLDSEIEALPLDGELFDTEKWVVWGLDRKRLALTAGITGAGAGALIDAALAGSSLMLGALGGGVIAGAGAWLGADQIANFRISGLPLGGYEARQGPIKSANFSFVVTGRFIALLDALHNRTHARRELVRLESLDLGRRLDALDELPRKTLLRSLAKPGSVGAVEQLAADLAPLLASVEPPST